jgi:hypothetical protein
MTGNDESRVPPGVDPEHADVARVYDCFLRRAAAYMAGAGVRQFLDIGSGIPIQGHVHEVAQAAAPQARVVYADLGPPVGLLINSTDDNSRKLF